MFKVVLIAMTIFVSSSGMAQEDDYYLEEEWLEWIEEGCPASKIIEARTEGYDWGYKVGYGEGKDISYNSGYNDGFARGRDSVDSQIKSGVCAFVFKFDGTITLTENPCADSSTCNDRNRNTLKLCILPIKEPN